MNDGLTERFLVNRNKCLVWLSVALVVVAVLILYVGRQYLIMTMLGGYVALAGGFGGFCATVIATSSQMWGRARMALLTMIIGLLIMGVGMAVTPVRTHLPAPGVRALSQHAAVLIHGRYLI